MSSLPNSAPTPPAPIPPARRPAQYTPGLSDGLGDRIVMFDAKAGSSVEVLRVNPHFSQTPDFEAALRQRVESLQRLHHVGLAIPWSVENNGTTNQLSVVSPHIPGRRLSEVLADARGPAFAVELMRQLTPALSALQQHAPGTAHGLLGPERVVVTREGRLVIVEPVFGTAIEGLRLPPRQLRSTFGLAVGAGADAPPLDARSDMVQLGFMALSLLVGRRLDPEEYPDRAAELLGELMRESSGVAARIGPWLESALQVGLRRFADAHEALESLHRLFDSAGLRAVGANGAPTDDVAENSPLAAAAAAVGGETRPMSDTAPLPASPQPMSTAVSSSASISAHGSHVDSSDVVSAPAASSSVEKTGGATIHPPLRSDTRGGSMRWILAGLAAVVVLQTGVIAFMYVTRGTTDPVPLVVNAPAREVSALQLSVPASDSRVPGAVPEATTPAPKPDVKDAVASAPEKPAPRDAGAGPRVGGLTVVSAVPLQIFENGVLVGVTGGPIAVQEGPHTFDLISEALGFRTQTAATVKSGQMLSVPVPVPNGKLSINAVPWADVWIDGTAAGQTPLANLTVPIGSHEVVFRHPQLGEKRQTVVVTVSGQARLSVVMQR